MTAAWEDAAGVEAGEASACRKAERIADNMHAENYPTLVEV